MGKEDLEKLSQETLRAWGPWQSRQKENWWYGQVMWVHVQLRGRTVGSELEGSFWVPCPRGSSCTGVCQLAPACGRSHHRPAPSSVAFLGVGQQGLSENCLFWCQVWVPFIAVAVSPSYLSGSSGSGPHERLALQEPASPGQAAAWRGGLLDSVSAVEQ